MGRDGGDGIARAGLPDPCLLGDVGKSPIAVIVIKNVGVTGKAAGAAHDRESFPLAKYIVDTLRRVKLDVIAHEKVEIRIAIVVEKNAASSPPNPNLVKTGPACGIGKRARSRI